VAQGYSCHEMVHDYGYDCSCTCESEDIYTDTGACTAWQVGYSCPSDVTEWCVVVVVIVVVVVAVVVVGRCRRCAA
jgi:hypothetical protein